MSASDHLHPKLFHGTSHWFSPGDTVNPTPDYLYGGPKVAFASTSKEIAGNVARSKGVGPVTATKPRQGVLFSPVFEVSNIGEPLSQNTLGRYGQPDSTVRNPNGFKVKKLAGMVKVADLDTVRQFREPKEWL